MYGGITGYVVFWKKILGFIWNTYDVYLLSLSAKSTFKIINLGGYFFRIGFLNY